MPDGKVCYIEIPATDIDRSARFYTSVFGWKVRLRGDGARAFDDTTGAVSGTWVLGRTPARDTGLLTYIMVDSIGATLRKIADAGGEAVMPSTPISPAGGAFATFRDPAGNLFGLYQEPPK
jgi:predicted enzyme related to lactoylglutathione lyase